MPSLTKSNTQLQQLIDKGQVEAVLNGINRDSAAAVNNDKQTPLHTVVMSTMSDKNKLQIALALIKNGTNPLAIDNRGKTASDYASVAVKGFLDKVIAASVAQQKSEQKANSYIQYSAVSFMPSIGTNRNAFTSPKPLASVATEVPTLTPPTGRVITVG